MKQFKMFLDQLYYDTFADFAAEMALGSDDVILTSRSVNKKFIEPLGLAAPVLIYNVYGAGEPTTDMVDAIRADLPSGTRRIIAIGGGSVLDTAKMLSITVSSGKTEDLFLSGEEPARLYELYAIPTTCGTGSEATNASVVGLPRLQTKRGMNHLLMFPSTSILIPELIMDLPYHIFSTSSIDALIHATESYLSPKATPHTELFSKEAIRLIMHGYRYVLEYGPEHWNDLAEEFLLASNYAGIAFCSAGCAAVHAMSYPLGGAYHIPHGEANQLVFAAVFRKYKDKQPEGKINALEELWADILGVSPEAALEAAFTLFDKIQPRKPLRAFGIAQSDLEDLVSGVLANQTRLLGNNYTELTLEDMVEIYSSIY